MPRNWFRRHWRGRATMMAVGSAWRGRAPSGRGYRITAVWAAGPAGTSKTAVEFDLRAGQQGGGVDVDGLRYLRHNRPLRAHVRVSGRVCVQVFVRVGVRASPCARVRVRGINARVTGDGMWAPACGLRALACTRVRLRGNSEAASPPSATDIECAFDARR